MIRDRINWSTGWRKDGEFREVWRPRSATDVGGPPENVLLKIAWERRCQFSLRDTASIWETLKRKHAEGHAGRP